MHVLNHFAYLDAGTGSLIIQALIGVVAGVAVFFRRIKTTVLSKLPGSKIKGEANKSASK